MDPRVPWNLEPHVMAHQRKKHYSQKCTWKLDSGIAQRFQGHARKSIVLSKHQESLPCTSCTAWWKMVEVDERWNATLLNIHTSLQLKSYTQQRDPALFYAVYGGAMSVPNIVYLHEKSNVTSWVTDWHEAMRRKACKCTVLIRMVEEIVRRAQQSHKLSSAGEMPTILSL